MRIALVACSAGKLDQAAPARDLYTSQLFKKAAAYAEQSCDQWFILSAKHGLLRPHDVVEPYDERLPRNPRSWQAQKWGDVVEGQLQDELRLIPSPVTLVILAGASYRDPWIRRRAYTVEIPMQGLGIGQQLAYLTQATL